MKSTALSKIGLTGSASLLLALSCTTSMAQEPRSADAAAAAPTIADVQSKTVYLSVDGMC